MVSTDRFRKTDLGSNLSFYKKTFTHYEITYCSKYKDPYPHFAGIFAAKEAVFKAINKYININLTQIAISHDKQKSPQVEVNLSTLPSEKLKHAKSVLQHLNIQVTISHTKSLAIAWSLICSQSSVLADELTWNGFDEKMRQRIQNEFEEQ